MPGTEQEWDTLSLRSLRGSQEDMRFVRGDLGEVVQTVEHPPHYNSGKVECIEAIEASMSSTEFKGYLKGNVLKYLWRYSYKGKPVEDLKKAQWYLNRLIAFQEEQ